MSKRTFVSTLTSRDSIVSPPHNKGTNTAIKPLKTSYYRYSSKY